ncbi:TIR domain-containing protein [Acinetobacter oleivorans]|uniref:TIR domain-containing protein n=1 Tax=Acinetobacter oleivorans TaxID=1148157 RepID=UPI00124FDAB2|nr:TIR domain-containing protein [Acinetobacter oleivorans]
MARRTFFSFHYQNDIWRVWNVKNSWVVSGSREAYGFFDGSVIEKKKRESDDSLKRFLREGLDNTSVTCVLAGQYTHQRRWVRYEIAQSIIKGNGLLSVFIHQLKDKNGYISIKGINPLDEMGIYLTNGSYYLAEWHHNKWIKYRDFLNPITLNSRFTPKPNSNSVVRLSSFFKTYDFTNNNGRSLLSSWIENAANQMGK